MKLMKKITLIQTVAMLFFKYYSAESVLMDYQR